MSRQRMFALLVLLSVMLVAGCSYQPARVKSEPLVIFDDGHGGRHGGDFCPPGQAKKGRC
ncbi:hypothetical protein F0A17_05250 [Billgrantia pellis]|uniref:Lipoprotein n=1 Tax=Billgrantia pellis TaxID=2606936 RepID=A0A7V7KIN8_9GAMM|nr:hypothetical protein [Halomonas pellis]KAA0013760.1 hypothetical protein F0A17_05250 [Halomonas pellis]